MTKQDSVSPQKALARAKKNAQDEYYTQKETVEAGIGFFLERDPHMFEGKTVYIPCDASHSFSEFGLFFLDRFNQLGLKRLYATGFDPDGNAPVMVMDESGLYSAHLDDDGDFRGPSAQKIRDKSDFIITNPPFSLFREFVPWAMSGGQQVLFLGPLSGVQYLDVFPYLNDNQIWIKKGDAENMPFAVPKGMPITNADAHIASKMGYHSNDQWNYTVLRFCRWYTNIDYPERHEPITLRTMAENLVGGPKIIRENGYRKYVNLNALEVPRVESIPSDYDGVMGVPITFFDNYSPEQFDIVGTSRTMEGYQTLDPDFIERYYEETGKRVKPNTNSPFVDGPPGRPYERVFIKSR